MDIRVFDGKQDLGAAAARDAAALIRAAVAARGRARIIAATGASQFEFLEALTALPDMPWAQVEMFHLDEYVGLSADHPASFRRYLRERLVTPTGLPAAATHWLDGERDPERVCDEVGAALRAAPIDVAFAGIGENGHLAFNDPPADFQAKPAYLVVELDEACRRQQVGEGWFGGLDEVPTRAISMAIPQLLQAAAILAIVPDARKARAVRDCLAGPVDPGAPASILQTHARTTVYLDRASAALLPPTPAPPPG